MKKWVLSESERHADCTHMHYWKKEGHAAEGNANDNAPLDKKPLADKAGAAAVAAPGNRSKPARFVKYTEEEY